MNEGFIVVYEFRRKLNVEKVFGGVFVLSVLWVWIVFKLVWKIVNFLKVFL